MSKIHRILITSSAMVEYLKLKFNCPDDLEVVDCLMDNVSSVIIVKIRSDEFPEVRDLDQQNIVQPGKRDIIDKWWVKDC